MDACKLTLQSEAESTAASAKTQSERNSETRHADAWSFERSVRRVPGKMDAHGHDDGHDNDSGAVPPARSPSLSLFSLNISSLDSTQSSASTTTMKSYAQNVRHAPSTPGGFVLVSLYSWMVMTLGFVIARFVRGLLVHRVKFGADDQTALASIVVYVGMVVGWQYAVDAGLGKNIATVDTTHVALFSRAVLAAQLLELFTMLFAKLSFAFLMHRVVPQTRIAKAALGVLLGVWSIFSCFAVAFRCSNADDWAVRPGRCHSSGPVIASIGLNMVTDLILSAWLFPTLAILSCEKEKRLTAMVLFGSRILVPMVAGGQIWAAVKAFSSENITRDIVDFAVLSHAVTSLSLMTANVPRVQQLLGTGGSGMLYPQIQASELSKLRASGNRKASGDNTLKLIPSGSAQITTTVTSNGSKERKKGRSSPEWPGNTTLGSVNDEYTSTTSLVDRIDCEGVVLEQRDFRMVVETRADGTKETML